MRVLQWDQIPSSLKEHLPDGLEGTESPVFSPFCSRWQVGSFWISFFEDPPSEERYDLACLTEASSFVVPSVVVQYGAWMLTTAPVGSLVQALSEQTQPFDSTQSAGEFQSVEAIAQQVGRSLRMLHDSSVQTFLLEYRWSDMADKVAGRLAAPDFSSEALPEPYCRFSAEELSAFFLAGKVTSNDPVLSFDGHFLDCLYIGKHVGLSDLSILAVRDRYIDLAATQLAVQEYLGAEAVFVFYDAYGEMPAMAKLDHYIFASHILRTAHS